MKSNKILIGIVSFFIAGLGHFFLGKNTKGALLLVLHILSFFARQYIHENFSMLLVALSFYAIYDCIKIINTQRRKEAAY